MTTENNPWDDEAISSVAPTTTPTKKKKVVHESKTHKLVLEPVSTEFDLEGLMTDFPTAKELERFVFDQTGIVLNLKGRANKLKYQTAMDVLNGEEVDPAYLGSDNPYVDKVDMIPIEDLKPVPNRDNSLPDPEQLQNLFYSALVPHPVEEYRARGKKCHCMFRKYKTGAISYEILGPLEQVAHGEKIDKFGRTRPEIYKWVDPRTGEQTVQREDGTLTPIGRRLRSMMQAMRVNKSSQWDVWIDREFGQLNQDAISNPWDLSKAV
jgi:hypothetical protein